MTHKSEKPCRPRKRSFLYLFVIVLLVAASVGVLAKYITGFSSGYKQADAAEFRFLTDYAENTSAAPYPVYDGTINFIVKNHDLLNISDKDINFKVFLNGTEKCSGALAGNAESSQSIALESLDDGDYTVTVTSTKPYIKTITLYFRVNTHYAGSFYTVTPHVGWIELDVYTGEDGEDIILAYGTLQPDNTISYTSAWKYGANASGTLNGLLPYSHYKLIFFGDYNELENPFKLTQNGKELYKGA